MTKVKIQISSKYQKSIQAFASTIQQLTPPSQGGVGEGHKAYCSSPSPSSERRGENLRLLADAVILKLEIYNLFDACILELGAYAYV